jgi:integrase
MNWQALRNQRSRRWKVWCFYISKSKTKAGIRHVPIHSQLSAIVDEYLRHSYGEYLFPQANKINRKDGKKGPYYSKTSPGCVTRFAYRYRSAMLPQLARDVHHLP